jgi:hypothetical protein
MAKNEISVDVNARTQAVVVNPKHLVDSMIRVMVCFRKDFVATKAKDYRVFEDDNIVL